MDPTTGTFLSVDPVVPKYDDPQSLNAYAYARNNPTSLIDPTGYCPAALFGSTCPPPPPPVEEIEETVPFEDLFADCRAYGCTESASAYKGARARSGDTYEVEATTRLEESISEASGADGSGPPAGVEIITVRAQSQQAAVLAPLVQAVSWVVRTLLVRPTAWLTRWAIVGVGAGPYFVRNFPAFAHSIGIARPANFQFVGQKPEIPSGLADFGRNAVQWGSGFRDALSRASNITPQEAARISPGQAAAARDFYNGALTYDPYNYTAAARIQLMERVIGLQK